MARRGGRLLRGFSRRTLLSVINVSTGKAVSSVKVGAQVSDMAFTANGRQLYVADMSGLLHMYSVETNFHKQASQPFSEHKTVFGRIEARSLAVYDPPKSGAHLRRRRRRSSAADPAAPVSYRHVALRHRVAGAIKRRFRSSEAVYFTNLQFKPYDAALRCPVLLGTDNRGVTRALTIVGGRFDEVDKHDFVFKPTSGAAVRHSAW